MARILRTRFQLLALALTSLVQIPALTWLCRLTHTPLPIVFALIISLPYLRKLERPWTGTPPSLWTSAALAWWCVCAVFAVLMLPATLAVRFGLSAPIAWGVAWMVALAVGIDAVLGRPRLRRRVVRIEGLPPELDGFRIGHLSDVHCGPHAPESRVAKWVRRLNALGVDVIAVTGDLITHGSSHVEAVARALGGLRAKDGAYVSMGNHDYFTDGEQLVRALERHGSTVLRNRGVVIERGASRLYLAGVDDTWTGRDDIDRALQKRPDGAPTVLLAHDPDLFPQAEQRGVELTLSGHTHGGQLALPGLSRISIARFMTRWTSGMYRRGRSWLYVNHGAGTTGPPARLGAPPELAVITLRRA